MLNFKVDEDLCTRCGLCVQDCTNRIIEKEGNDFPRIPAEKENFCLRCQHCLAICPTGALSILGKFPADSIPIPPGAFPDFEVMNRFIRGRRSVRHYEHENVDRELIVKILASLSHAPTGANASELTFNVIEDGETLDRIGKKTVGLIKSATADSKMPKRYEPMLRLPEDVLFGMLFRGAPHVLVVTAPLSAPCANEDAAIAVAYFDLLAQSAGLGCVWWGFLRLFAHLVPEIRPLFGIPDDHAFSAALFGYPAIRFARTVQKDDAARIRRVT